MAESSSVNEASIAMRLFETLMQSVGEDLEAREGLALAYQAMESDERTRLVETIVRDAGSRDWVTPLLTLLSVEDDLERADRIASFLSASSPTRRVDVGYLYGDELQGGVVLVRPRFSGLISVLVVSWTPRELTSQTIELAPKADLERLLAALDIPSARREIRGDHAIEHLSVNVWRAIRRGGTLPDDLRRHADLFDVNLG